MLFGCMQEFGRGAVELGVMAFDGIGWAGPALLACLLVCNHSIIAHAVSPRLLSEVAKGKY